MKVLVVCHRHPNFGKGGAELAGFHLFRALNELPAHQAWFLARADEQFLRHETELTALSDREFLVSGRADYMDLLATADLGARGAFAEWLRELDPDVIHFHHYLYLGVDMIFAAKRICPGARIVLTLHEFVAICMRSGTMVKSTGELCYRSSPRECQQCFPQLSTRDVFLRTNYVKTMFGSVDRFVAPSEFLKKRYVEWGLAEESVQVIENGVPDGERLSARRLGPGEGRGRFAFLGQVNEYKGLDVILESFRRLPKAVRERVRLDVFGSGLGSQGAEFRANLHALLDDLNDCVSFRGAYEPNELKGLMRDIDWVVMGSIWWENSPLVIQEAFKFGRPVICPDIGGMAEKVLPGKGGLHFRARDSESLARLICDVSTPGDERFDRLLESLPYHMSVASSVDLHLDLYSALRGLS